MSTSLKFLISPTFCVSTQNEMAGSAGSRVKVHLELSRIDFIRYYYNYEWCIVVVSTVNNSIAGDWC